MPKFCMPTFGCGRNNSKDGVHLPLTSPISKMYWDTRRYFLAHVVSISQMSCRDLIYSGRPCSPGEVGTRNVYTVSPASLFTCIWVLRSRRGGNQRVSLQKCINLVIARTDWRMHDLLVSSQSICVVLRVCYGCLAVKSIWGWSRI